MVGEDAATITLEIAEFIPTALEIGVDPITIALGIGGFVVSRIGIDIGAGITAPLM